MGLETVYPLNSDNNRHPGDLGAVSGFCLDGGHTQQDQYRCKK